MKLPYLEQLWSCCFFIQCWSVNGMIIIQTYHSDKSVQQLLLDLSQRTNARICWKGSHSYLSLKTCECMCVCVCMCTRLYAVWAHVSQCKCGGQRTTWWSQLSPSAFTWVTGIELALSGFGVSPLACWVISLGPYLFLFAWTISSPGSFHSQEKPGNSPSYLIPCLFAELL